MAQIIELQTYSDQRGNLTVIEDQLPFEIKRVFYIYRSANATRGGHRHKITRQALICVSGNCIVTVNDGKNKNDFILDCPTKCLILEPDDWHTMHHFSNDAVLLVLASTKYDPNDYIYEEPK